MNGVKGIVGKARSFLSLRNGETAQPLESSSSSSAAEPPSPASELPPEAIQVAAEQVAPVPAHSASAPQPEPVLAALDAFLAAQFREATTEDAQRFGGLNGHLSVARLLILQPPLVRGVADVLVALAALYHRLHHLAEALEHYATLTGASKEDMPIFRLIGAIAKVPPAQRARELYAAALVADGDHAWAAFNLATLRALGAEDGADELYRQAAQRDAFLRPYAALRRASLAERRDDWTAAAALYVEAAAGIPHLGPWHENAARCLRRCGRVEEALRHYERALDWVLQPGAEFIIHPPIPHAATYAENLPLLLRQLLGPPDRPSATR